MSNASLTINRRSLDQWRERREKLLKQLEVAYSHPEGPRISRSDLRNLAANGSLSLEDRDVYDELHRIEWLLGIEG